MVKLANTLCRLKSAKIMVIGDMLLDSYTFGKARRLSPEAPIAIVDVQREEHRLGGAGNVILNLLSLEAQVIAVGRIGDDWAGKMFTDKLAQEGTLISLFQQKDYQTPVKNRVISDSQQIVRIDHEYYSPLNEQLEQRIINELPKLLEGVQVIALSDYGKGFLTSTLIQAVMEEAKKRHIKVITDPKGQDFTKYRGTTLIKPNLSEAYAAANLPSTTPIATVAQKILEITQAEIVMITRSEAGISLFDRKGAQYDFPVQIKEVKDVTGAGDTVLAMLAHALANHLTFSEAAELCNIAAGIAIEHIGCARISLTDLANRLVESNMTHKVFDHEQILVLQKILEPDNFNLLLLETQQVLTASLFQAIQTLSKGVKALVVSIMGEKNEPVFIEMLASLKEIRFILTHQESVQKMCRQIKPASVHHFEHEHLKLVTDFALENRI